MLSFIMYRIIQALQLFISRHKAILQIESLLICCRDLI